MVLVVTDKPELAMRYASAIGVLTVGKNSVRLRDIQSCETELLKTLREQKFISTFFRGETYLFISLNEGDYAPSKMAQYDASFESIENRSVPFFPEMFEYRFVNSSTASSADIYKKLIHDSKFIINATSDTISGELTFNRAISLFGGPDGRPIFRVRPLMLKEDRILAAFNSLQSRADLIHLVDACLLRERLDWLVNANLSTAIMQHDASGMAVAVGRLEMVFLNQLFTMQRAQKSWRLRAVVNAGDNRTCFTADIITAPMTKKQAEYMRDKILKGAARREVHGEGQISTSAPQNPPLCNAVKCIIEAGKYHDIPAKESAKALWSLFYNGFITWPSPSCALPWRAKQDMLVGVTTLSSMPEFRDRIKPRDVDTYGLWERENGDPYCLHMGIMVSDKNPNELFGIEKTVYNIIGEAITHSMTRNERIKTFSFSGQVKSLDLTAVFSKARLCDFNGNIIDADPSDEWDDWTIGPYSLQDIEILPPIEQHQIRDVDLIASVLPYFDGAFTEDIEFFITPLNNLNAWGLIQYTEDGSCILTNRAEVLRPYLEDSPLANPKLVTAWDHRLKMVARNEANAGDFISDMHRYITDLVEFVKVGFTSPERKTTVPVGPCPHCGGGVVWNGACWACKQCDYKVPATVKGHQMTEQDMRELLIDGQTRMLFDFQGKAGKYPARFILTDQGTTKMSFESRCACPRCLKPMREFSWGLACPDRDGCGYSIGLEPCGVRISEEDEVALFTTGKTALIKNFVSKKGKRFAAFLTLDDKFNLRFEFPGNGESTP